MAHLPPDLSRVGDELTAAAERSLRARRRRRRVLAARLAAVAAAGVVAVAALQPAADSGTGSAATLAATAESAMNVPAGCDRPRGARFSLPACASLLTAAHRAEATLPHGTSLWSE